MKGDSHRRWPRRATRAGASADLVRMAGSSGDAAVDRAVQRVAASMGADQQPAPADMGVVILRLMQVVAARDWSAEARPEPERGAEEVTTRSVTERRPPNQVVKKSAFGERIRSHDEEQVHSDDGGRRRRG